MNGLKTAIFALGLAAAAGCSSSTGTLEASSSSAATTTTTTTVALRDWGKETLGPLLDRLGNGFIWVGGAAKSMDYADSRAGCRDLDSTVRDLDAARPAPTPSVDADLERAVTNLRKFTGLCQGLSPGTTSAEFSQMDQYRDDGMAALQEAVTEIKASP